MPLRTKAFLLPEIATQNAKLQDFDFTLPDLPKTIDREQKHILINHGITDQKPLCYIDFELIDTERHSRFSRNQKVAQSL